MSNISETKANQMICEVADVLQRADICVTRTIWTKVRDCIAEVLDSYSLLDLVNEARLKK